MADAMTGEAATMFSVRSDGGVLVATLDMPGRTMNVFSWALMDQFDALLDRIEGDPAIGALVLTSGKPTFLAGADLEMVQTFAGMGRSASRAELHAVCGRLGRLFNRLEAIGKPTVAAINGLAMGGGLEVAMACSRRLAADDPKIQLGLPEVKLGLMAAAGGTQRLPRLVGIEKSLDLLLSGASVTPAGAKALGLVDELVAPADLVETAIARARDLMATATGRPTLRPLDTRPFDVSAPDAVERILLSLGHDREKTRRYPAYAAAVRATIGGAHLPPGPGGDHEMDCFVDLMKDPVAGRMVTTLFLNRQRSDKLVQQFRLNRDARFAIAGQGGAAETLRAALAASRAQLADAAEASPADVVIATPEDPASAKADLLLFDQAAPVAAARAGVVLSRPGALGLAIEVFNADDAARGKGLALASQLRATPYLSAAPRSLLATLAQARTTAKAEAHDEETCNAAMARAAQQIAVEDKALADVAAVVSGLFPAWAGGPFTWLAEQAES